MTLITCLTMSLPFFFLISPMFLQAETSSSPQPEASFNDLLKMDIDELMDVTTVVASKREQKVPDAPSSVTVFTRQEILDMGITSVEELMNFVPGFQATRELVFEQGYLVSARGQSTPQTSYNILFMIDGERLNISQWGGALGVNHLITLANVKQVEVIRGPGSALYGTSALTGVINIITETDANEVFISGGNLRSKELYTHVSHQNGAVKTSLFVRHFDDRGQRYDKKYIASSDPKAEVVDDPKEGNDIYLTYAWNDTLRINARYMRRYLENFLSGWGLLTPGINNYAGKQSNLHVDYQLLKTDQWKLTLQGGYMHVRDKQSVGFPQDEMEVYELQEIAEHEWHMGLETQSYLSETHEFSAGLEWRRPYRTLEKNTDIDLATHQIIGENNVKTVSRQTYSLYLQDQYQFDQALETTLGIRYDHYSDFGSTTNPRIAVVYAVSPHTKFKGMYGQAFRAPSFGQLWAGGGLGNPQLKPEKVKTSEFAWIQEYPSLRTILTYFRSKTQDKIDTKLIPLNQGFSRIFSNMDDLDTAGWELEASTQIGSLTTRLTYTYLTKMIQNPRSLPKQTFSVITNYQVGRWNINVHGYAHDEMEQSIRVSGRFDLKTLDDYWKWNGTLRYAWDKHLTWVGRIDNVLDEEFSNPTKLLFYTEGVPHRGRTYSIGVELKF